MFPFTNGSGNAYDVQLTVIDKAKLFTGTTNYGFVYANGSLPVGAWTLQPCTVVGTNGPANVAYFGETFPGNSLTTAVRVWALADPLGARTLTSAQVTIPDNGGPPRNNAPQAGTSLTVDPLDGRAQGNAFWQNGAVWFCHTA